MEGRRHGGGAQASSLDPRGARCCCEGVLGGGGGGCHRCGGMGDEEGGMDGWGVNNGCGRMRRMRCERARAGVWVCLRAHCLLPACRASRCWPRWLMAFAAECRIGWQIPSPTSVAKLGPPCTSPAYSTRCLSRLSLARYIAHPGNTTKGRANAHTPESKQRLMDA